jgi:hypothetical protein
LICDVLQVRIAVALVTSYQVPSSNVAVICTTRAQRVFISKKISSVGNTPSCLTVEESQGKNEYCTFVFYQKKSTHFFHGFAVATSFIDYYLVYLFGSYG